MNPLFDLQRVKVVYGRGRKKRRVALEIPSLTLWPGKAYAFLGPNGSGKTTLLHVLNGLLKPAEGMVYFQGHPMGWNGHDLAFRRKMTLVMQSPWLFRGTVLANVSYGLRARGVNRRETEQRSRNILRDMGLLELSDRQARDVSGGEAQRIALARALVLEPEVLLLDEPTANLDEESSVHVDGVLGRLSASGRSVILTTHRVELAELCGAERMILREGRLKSDTTP
jgi:tungstate transport system ATP-binding protein